MPTNLYGPGDSYHPENSHVIPVLIRRFHEAKRDELEKVAIWGAGQPMRKFLHLDDMATAALHLMDISKDEYDQHTQPMLSHIRRLPRQVDRLKVEISSLTILGKSACGVFLPRDS